MNLSATRNPCHTCMAVKSKTIPVRYLVTALKSRPQHSGQQLVLDLLLPKHADTYHVAGVKAVFAMDCFNPYISSISHFLFTLPLLQQKGQTISIVHKLQPRRCLADHQSAFNSPVFNHFVTSLGYDLTLVSGNLTLSSLELLPYHQKCSAHSLCCSSVCSSGEFVLVFCHQSRCICQEMNF